MFTFLIITFLFQTATLARSTNPCNCEIGKTCNANNNDTIGGCKCMQGFKGENCTDVDECTVGERDPCFHRGLCYNTIGSYRCHCHRGWRHDHNDDPCTIDIDECAKNTILCKNGGTCRNTNGSYDCDCIKPWEGQNCTYYNSCMSNPCQNGGKCTKSGADSDKTHNCTCKAGWQGFNCSTDVNECSLNGRGVCLNDGNCTNTPGSYICTCDTGWSGKNCNESTSILTTKADNPSTKSITEAEIPSTISTTEEDNPSTIPTTEADDQSTNPNTEADNPSTKSVTEAEIPSTISTTEEDNPSTIPTTEADDLSTNPNTEADKLPTTVITATDIPTTTMINKTNYQLTKMITNTQNNLKETTKEDKTPVIVGAAVGSIIIVVAACVAGYFLYKRKHARVVSENITNDMDRNEKFDEKRITKKEAIELPNC
ncbi:protein eyes shut-like isoform X2 [Mercenaria mercenaria]|uniref:protein eyes shut-like isoform X2 n=1 Tax=Mercenaria mercenaria TaxID=6596 RepID=UPI00234EA829|nr:protein eyes shut-like isoform X2 [Mercenaria mercenaria]